MRYLLKANARITPQSQPIPGTKQVPNSAGGFAWAVDDWTRLDRFLILGAEGGSYYASERKLTLDNAEAVGRCVDADGLRVVSRVVEISQAGRAPKNDPALFVLALCAGLGNDATRAAAYAALPQVARIGTHLFHFLAYVEGFRGWGRGLRRAVGGWYNRLPAAELAYQAIKYQRRDGWGHRDALRLAHPQAASEQHNAIFHWITRGWPEIGTDPHPDEALRVLWAFERVQRAEREQDVVALIRDYTLPREAVPTQWLTSAKVWEALLEHMPMEAMVRNLATMTRVGLLKRSGSSTTTVTQRLRSQERLQRARMHPIKLLAALTTYRQGRGMRSSETWEPVTSVVDALNDAFYLAFQAVEPTGKHMVLALDVSGSMSWGSIAGIPGLTPRIGAAAMALVTAATEKNWTVVAFSHQMVPVQLSPRQRLDDVLAKVDKIPMGGTDCALPMLWALEQKLRADAFVVYTDSETWYGQIHPAQALRQYRERTGIPAKLAVVGMVSNQFSIADPNDGGMLDCVGFDTAAPALIADFVRG
ncbi:MAG TPA: TROVE domain-containing protein [Roseiflexaceae bacterium]|nr:TROVE domain-containing protein [Roseiflexaceae bacterium]